MTITFDEYFFDFLKYNKFSINDVLIYFFSHSIFQITNIPNIKQKIIN